MKRFQARRGNGRFTRNTFENTLGLHVKVCPTCGRFNPYDVGAPMPEKCHDCGASLAPVDDHGHELQAGAAGDDRGPA